MPLDQQAPIGSGFHAKSEPADVMADIDLTGRTAVVTGGYSGIGAETTRALAAAGATVIVPVRDPAKAAGTLAGIDGDVRTVAMDLGDLATVRTSAAGLVDDLDALDLLITNAGIMATPEGRVGPGWERQFGVNHMGHFALTQALMPLLRAADAPRVVALSSVAHRRGGIRWDDMHFQSSDYDKWAAYAQAKSANALFAVELSTRLADDGGRAFSVHPGGIFTPLQRDLPLDEQIQLGWRGPDGEPNPAVADIFKTPTQGCATTLWAATSPLLADRHGLYCEDTDVAAAATTESPRWMHVASHAVDVEDAARLWALSEGLLANA